MKIQEVSKIHFQLSPELKQWAEVQASMEQTSLASIIRRALLYYLQHKGQDSGDLWQDINSSHWNHLKDASLKDPKK